MAYTIESDKSRQVKWVVREDTDVSLTITVTLASAAYNLSSYTFIAEIFKVGGTSPILTLTQGSGITNNGAAGTLVLAITDTQLNLTPDEYFWKLRTTSPTDNLWFNGIFDVKGYLYDSSADDSVSIALTVGGDSVSVTLTLAGSLNGSGTSNQITYWTDEDTLAALNTATYPSLTELSYVKGVTSSIQTALAAKQALIITETTLTDGASIALVQQNNVLATSRSTITFTISNTSTFIYLTITLTGTSLVLTFPANSLCVGSSGTASGDNTCTLTGTSGDVYEIAIKKRVSTYSVVAKNFGQ